MRKHDYMEPCTPSDYLASSRRMALLKISRGAFAV